MSKNLVRRRPREHQKKSDTQPLAGERREFFDAQPRRQALTELEHTAPKGER